MQAKIIDFASDKLAKSLQKIEKEDVMNAYSKVSSRIRRNKYLSKKDEKFVNVEENREMLDKKFDNKPDVNKDNSKIIDEPRESKPETLAKIEKVGESNSDGNFKILPLMIVNK